MRNKWFGYLAACCAGSMLFAGEPRTPKAVPGGNVASPAAGESAQNTAREMDFAARRMLDKAKDLIAASEHERGVKMIETLLDQYPKSAIRYQAYLELGRHYIETRQQAKAVTYLRNLKDFEKREAELVPEERELYIESLYLSGIGYFQMRQYGQATPLLRKITTQYPNTVWANQAFFYIGMCHFTQGRWSQAIDALGLVGTFVDSESPTTEFVEAGYRFFVKVEDADLPVLYRLGKETSIEITTQHGDKERIVLAPLGANSDTFIGSIATDVGVAKPGDKTLQVRGGDAISAAYVDDNTKEGKKNEPRAAKTVVVSTASLNFTLGTYEQKSTAAFIGQPLFVLLQDVDCDTTPQADGVKVRVVSRYKVEDEQNSAERTVAEIDSIFSGKEETWKIRDEVTLELKEIGSTPIHSGRFGGSVKIAQASEATNVDKTDDLLACAIDDDVVAYYVDELHIGGKSPRQVETHARVIGEIDSRARAPLYEVFDPVIKAQKALVEARAHLELARIFKSMGLMKGVEEKCKIGLEHADSVIQTRTPLPSALREEAFQLKWEMFIAQENFPAAISTCQLFNQLFPNSPFVDQALLGIGNVKMEGKHYGEAIGVFRQVLNLKNSQAKAEAQFKIAECTRKQPQKGSRDQAINEYKLCAERYPDSPFAGAALGEMVDYYVDTQDFRLANDLLERIFQDYPDAQFLDGMLLKWVIVAFKTGDVQKAYDKCSQLLFDYPSSAHAEKAKELLPRLEQRLKGTQKDAAAAPATEEKKQQ